MKRLSLLVMLILSMLVGITSLTALTMYTAGQAPAQFAFTGVYAEAINSANLRAWTTIDAEIIGQIAVGTRYPVIGASALYPWLLLGDVTNAQPIGWVFKDLVTVYGDLFFVPITEIDLANRPTLIPTQPPFTPSLSPTPPLIQGGTVLSAEQTVVQPTTSPTLTPTRILSVFGTTQGEVNIRYKPDANAERLGVAQAGDVFEITGYHTQFPWVQVAYPSSPNGSAWILIDLLQITGDVYSTRAISTTNFSSFPTLTPTSVVLGQSAVRREASPVPLSPEFEALGRALWDIILTSGFDPQTSAFGALYLQDLRTGQEIMFGNEVAFSGTSINKVPIMVETFGILNGDPDGNIATNIANMMICSENVATNRLLALIGNGDEFAGAEAVSDFLLRLGARRTFITAPISIPGATPIPPSQPIRYPKTDADQTKANADVTSQVTVDEMGFLLSSVYQCAFNESGPLLTNFSQGTYTPQECRKMLHVMANNTVDGLIKAGVPEGVTVAHKHGWINDTHGNAAIVFSPGGDYVLVMMLHKPGWLQFEGESLPVFAEVSRAVYNYYNPSAPLAAIRDGSIPRPEDCQFFNTPLMQDLTDPGYGITAPANTGDIIR